MPIAKSAQYRAPNLSPEVFAPQSRMTFQDVENPLLVHTAQFNPTSISIPYQVRLTKQQPIGWSGNPLQYGGTDDPSFSVTLSYSLKAFEERQGPQREAQLYDSFLGAIAFFRSFLYGERPGLAPAKMLVILPKTFSYIVVLQGMTPTFNRWRSNMQVANYELALDMQVDSDGFITSDFAGRHGLSAHGPSSRDFSPKLSGNVSATNARSR